MDKIRVWLGWPHVVAPTTIGAGDHDCALASLYWAAPGIPENRIVEAFGLLHGELALWRRHQQGVPDSPEVPEGGDSLLH